MFDVSQFLSHCSPNLSTFGGKLQVSDEKLDGNLVITPIAGSVSTTDPVHGSPGASSTPLAAIHPHVTQSSSSPGLIAAVCHWLKNLVAAAPQDATDRLMDEGMVQSLIGQVAHFPVEIVNSVLRRLQTSR